MTSPDQQASLFPSEVPQTPMPMDIDDIARRIAASADAKPLPTQSVPSEAAIDQGHAERSRTVIPGPVVEGLFDNLVESTPVSTTKSTSELSAAEQTKNAKAYLARLDEEGMRGQHQIYDPHDHPHLRT